MEPEADVKGTKGKQAAATKQRSGTAQRKEREAAAAKKAGGKPGAEPADAYDDLMPQMIEDAMAAELLAQGVCFVWAVLFWLHTLLCASSDTAHNLTHQRGLLPACCCTHTSRQVTQKAMILTPRVHLYTLQAPERQPS